MKRFALVVGGVVANVTEQADSPSIGGTWLEVTGETVGPGHRRVGDAWVSPAPAVPQAVTRRQARQALLLAGKLDDVQPAIDAIPDATQRGLMQIEWDDSLTFERQRPSLIALAAGIGIDAAGLDALFVSAAGLE